MIEYNCSSTMCMSDWWKSKYKTLRAASVCLGAMRRKSLKEDTKNWQRITALAARIIQHEVEYVDLAYQIRSIALQTIRERQ